MPVEDEAEEIGVFIFYLQNFSAVLIDVYKIVIMFFKAVVDGFRGVNAIHIHHGVKMLARQGGIGDPSDLRRRKILRFLLFNKAI